jgi:hypothetical protein
MSAGGQAAPGRPRGVLHFYPGDKRVLWVVRGKVAITAEAWGGEEPQAGARPERMRPQRTTPGRFIIHSYAPYRTKSWDMAKIRWGTELKVDATKENEKRVFYRTGLRQPAWRPVDSLIPWLTYDRIREFYGQLYGDSGHHDSNHDGVPDRWIFNEFGPMAVRYFRDRNNNRVLDGDERLSGEMMHTIPLNEAQELRGQPIKFTVSHGCIHIAPRARDQLKDAGAFKPGTTFIVHGYDERMPVVPKPSVRLPDALPPPPETRASQLVEEKTFIDILVVDQDDNPLSGWRYQLELHGQKEEGSLAGGHLAKRNIEAGTAKFSLLPPQAPAGQAGETAQGPSAEEPAPAPGGEVAPDVIADDAFTLRLIDAKGAPIAGQAVSVQLADGSVRAAVTDAGGRVALAPVPPGDCVVTIA